MRQGGCLRKSWRDIVLCHTHPDSAASRRAPIIKTDSPFPFLHTVQYICTNFYSRFRVFIFNHNYYTSYTNRNSGGRFFDGRISLKNLTPRGSDIRTYFATKNRKYPGWFCDGWLSYKSFSAFTYLDQLCFFKQYYLNLMFTLNIVSIQNFVCWILILQIEWEVMSKTKAYYMVTWAFKHRPLFIVKILVHFRHLEPKLRWCFRHFCVKLDRY